MIIHRAFVREVLQTCGLVSVILLGIFLLGRLMEFLRQAAEGDIPANSVLLLLLLKLITYLDILAPLVLYISTLLVLGRWIRDNELTVISACGMGMNQLLKPALTLSTLIGGMTALFALYLSPLSAEAARVVSEEIRNRAELAGVVAGVFTPMRDGRGVYFVEKYDSQNGAFGGIFVHHGSGGGEDAEDEVVVAESGYRSVDEKTDADFLILKNGSRYRGTAGAAEYGVLDFETYGLRIEPRNSAARELPLDARPTWVLPTGDAAAVGEFHWRVSKVVLLPILLVFALAFSALTYRRSRFPGMLPALLTYFVYTNFLGLGVVLIRRGIGHPHLTLWAIHLLFLGCALYLLHRRNRPLA